MVTWKNHSLFLHECVNWIAAYISRQAMQLLRPNKKISVFRVMGLKILGRIGTHIFKKKFWKKNTILCILKDISPFKMHRIIFFPENLKKSRFHQ